MKLKIFFKNQYREQSENKNYFYILNYNFIVLYISITISADLLNIK